MSRSGSGHRADPVIAIVGATGAVGQELLRVFDDRSFPIGELRLLASERSVGRSVAFRGREVGIARAAPEAFDGVDFAVFSAGSDVARSLAPAAVRAGAVVVDNSSAFRLDPDVPLVVPEVNAGVLERAPGIVANPNCSTILLSVVLAPIHRAAGVRRVVVSTYQAASGAGARAVEELRRGVAAHLAGEVFPADALPHRLAFNVFARIDRFGADGYTREEDKLRSETRKILGLPDLDVEATCVRVPVERCHAEAVTIEFERPLEPAACRAVLEAAPGVVVCDDPAADLHPQPLHVAGEDAVFVGRVRESRVFDPGLALWLVGDQLRKGAALNAVQILERLRALH